MAFLAIWSSVLSAIVPPNNVILFCFLHRNLLLFDYVFTCLFPNSHNKLPPLPPPASHHISFKNELHELRDFVSLVIGISSIVSDRSQEIPPLLVKTVRGAESPLEQEWWWAQVRNEN